MEIGLQLQMSSCFVQHKCQQEYSTSTVFLWATTNIFYIISVRVFFISNSFLFYQTLIITIWTLIRQYLHTNIADRRSILWLNRRVDSVMKFVQYHHVMHIFCMPLVMMALAKHRTAMKYNLSSLMFISTIGTLVCRCEELPWCQDVSGNWPILV